MAGSLFVLPRQTPVNGSGRPYPGATLTFYAAGTNTLTTVYADSAQATALQNPLTADSAGQFPAVYYAESVRVVCKDAAGNTLWTEDNVPVSGSGGGGGTTGETGPSGLSVAELAIYQRADSAPSTPTGGSYSFATQTLTPPAGWSSEIPAGSAPAWASRAVAAVEGSTGTDSVLAWSSPVQVFAEGQSVDIIFKRNAGQPATPAPSAGVPAGWYTDVDSVPVSSNILWSSVGTRAHSGENWTWQLPIQVEGDQGDPGPGAVLYYILPTSGTAIKNSSGVLTLEAHKLEGGTDTKLTSGTIKLYSGTTEITTGNGFYTGSDGYTGKFDSGDISGNITVTLKDGPSGAALDTCTLVDVTDGSTGGVNNAVYGYVEAPFLAWTRASDGSTWTPSATTCQQDVTFVQGGVDVARDAYVITRASDGTLTGAGGTHASGDLNTGRITVTTSGSGTTVFTTKFAYSNAGDTCKVIETVYSSLAGTDGTTGPTGPTGPSPLVLSVTKRAIPLQAYTNGTVVSYASANGQATVWRGTTDMTATATIAASASGCTGTVNTAANTPVSGQPKGYYQVTAMSADTATLTLTATESGDTATEVISLSRVNVGYEIVGSLPVTNLFQGRMVFLTTDNKLYRYTGSAWTREVDGADLKANSVTTNSISAGAITAAKISTTSLSALSANLGTVTAGTAKAASDQMTVDFDNARIVFDTAPGSAGVGYVRLMGYGFGPSNNYIDWYGPKPAAASSISQIVAGLTDAGALSYQKTDGTFVAVNRQRGEFEPKAWVVMNGNGSATILDRFNISSVVRNSTGRYTVTFASALANANFGVAGSADQTGTTLRTVHPDAASRTTSGFSFETRGGGGSANDSEYIALWVFGSNVAAGSNVSTPSGGAGGGTRGLGNIP